MASAGRGQVGGVAEPDQDHLGGPPGRGGGERLLEPFSSIVQARVSDAMESWATIVADLARARAADGAAPGASFIRVSQWVTPEQVLEMTTGSRPIRARSPNVAMAARMSTGDRLPTIRAPGCDRPGGPSMSRTCAASDLAVAMGDCLVEHRQAVAYRAVGALRDQARASGSTSTFFAAAIFGEMLDQRRLRHTA